MLMVYLINKKIIWFVLVIGLFLAVLGSLTVRAQDFTQGYSTDDKLIRGSIVSRSITDDNKVDAANLDNLSQLFGVVVNADQSALTISSDTAGAYVATTGKFEVLVTTQSGEVKTGDYITASSISGMGMKAGETQELVIGRALQDFDTSDVTMVLGIATVKGLDGSSHDVVIGRVLADLDVKRNPRLSQSAPELLVKFSELIAGKPVTLLRVYVALAVLIVTAALGGSMLYAGIRSTFVAIGRNPLAKKSVMRGLLQVIITSMGIFLSGFFAVYLILKV